MPTNIWTIPSRARTVSEVEEEMVFLAEVESALVHQAQVGVDASQPPPPPAPKAMAACEAFLAAEPATDKVPVMQCVKLLTAYRTALEQECTGDDALGGGEGGDEDGCNFIFAGLACDYAASAAEDALNAARKAQKLADAVTCMPPSHFGAVDYLVRLNTSLQPVVYHESADTVGRSSCPKNKPSIQAAAEVKESVAKVATRKTVVAAFVMQTVRTGMARAVRASLAVAEKGRAKEEAALLAAAVSRAATETANRSTAPTGHAAGGTDLNTTNNSTSFPVPADDDATSGAGSATSDDVYLVRPRMAMQRH